MHNAVIQRFVRADAQHRLVMVEVAATRTAA
jgi:hypothetical protein